MAHFLSSSPQDLARRPKLWETYTRDFISYHALRPDQASSAWTVWRECFDSAEHYLADHRRDLDRIERRLATMKSLSSQDRGKEGSSAQTRQVAPPNPGELQASLEAQWAPVENLFAQRLRPRLRALLTREQLVAGEESRKRFEAATQSSVAPDE